MNREIFLHNIKRLFSEKLLPRLREEADRGRWEGFNSSMFQLSIYEDSAWIELSYTAAGYYRQSFSVATWNWTFEDPVFIDKVPFLSAFACYEFYNFAEKKETRAVLDRANKDLIHKMMLVLEEHHLLSIEIEEETGIEIDFGDFRLEDYKYLDDYITFLDIVLPLLPTPKEKYEQLLENSKPFKILAEKLSLELK